jgi:hypothetical protein
MFKGRQMIDTEVLFTLTGVAYGGQTRLTNPTTLCLTLCLRLALLHSRVLERFHTLSIFINRV